MAKNTSSQGRVGSTYFFYRFPPNNVSFLREKVLTLLDKVSRKFKGDLSMMLKSFAVVFYYPESKVSQSMKNGNQNLQIDNLVLVKNALLRTDHTLNA